ncbi:MULTISPECIES: M67 family metallopeptidase [Rossellomorea]|uniref:M67 family metallopeptidase n=1 Tax=Rossellomorea TaxID=2837508 RepID=UPI0018CFB38F|nr:M67 family metallopeptidase [Rossellomorea marisflavi]MBV6683333.1 M67 family metallopeptidase [Bacillus sp. JRC01]UKS67210.1 M67 family metallopeptidase [Rossellomorea marisflavi]
MGATRKESVFLSKNLYSRLILEAKSSMPNEACGLLSGSGSKCTRVWPMRNTEPSPFSFAIDEGEKERAVREMHERNEAFIGLYHSHPNGLPVPSQDDIDHAPDVFYFIISVGGAEEGIRCYRIRGRQVMHLTIIVE